MHVEDGLSGRKLLVITEIPYQINKSAMLEKILKLSEEKKSALSCIYDIRDESDRTGMRAVIELKKDADAPAGAGIPVQVQRFADHLRGEHGGHRRAASRVLMGLKAMLGYFIAPPKNVVTRAHPLRPGPSARPGRTFCEGLMIAVDNLDEVIALIRASKNPKEAKQGLMARFELDDAQAQAILDMRLQRLTNLELLALKKEYEDLLKLIHRLEAILKSEKKLLGVIKEELEAIAAEYGDDRRTVLEAPDNAQAQLTEEPPAAEEAVVAFTYGGQLKRMSPQLYRKTPLETAEDAAERPRFLFQTDTEETLLFFTNLGNCYSLRVDALPEIKPKDRGNLLTGVLAGLESGEAPLWITCCRPAQLAKEPDLLFVTRRGMVKRTAAADYDVRGKKFAAVNLKAGDSLLTVLPAFTQDELLMFTRAGMCIRFGLDTVPVQGRISAGVRGMQVDEEDELIWCGQVGENDEMVLFSERGYGKRILSCDFEKQNRNGKGVKSFYFNKSGSNGKYLAGLYLAGKGPCRLTIHQAQSPDTVLNKDEIRLQSKTDRGVPYVMAVLEDVVTGLTGQEES